ncbi:cation:proton antiporter [Sulfurovum sp.]|uniref:cation:proton antiporter domain-containing protein n=1 Tax=Sulfurovum sp. TaxID=1969726 RepID=UPI0025F004C4|nr:cation:proton antiporter [Sulfurovum sp.]
MILETIVLTIFIATVANLVLTRLHIPTIIGYIATGVIISLSLGLTHEANSKELHTIAEFGIVFLMFTIGLEFSIVHLIKMRKEVFVIGGLQVGLSMSVFFLLAYYLFDIEVKSSLIIAAALALSSTAIVLKILNSNRDINKEYGQRSLGILIFQDMMVIPILLMITLFSKEDLSLGTLLWETLRDAVILFIVLWSFGKFILEPFFNEVVKSNSDEIFVGSILFLVMGASLLAHSLGFSYSLGAFIAGMIIAETRYKHQVQADLIPFRDLLLGIFFITVGMQIEFSVIAAHYLSILGLFLLFTSVKISIIYLLLKRVSSKRIAIKTALALFQLGEFGLVVFELAGTEALVDDTVSQVLIATIILSMVVTPFVLRNISFLADRILGQQELEPLLPQVRRLKNHVVVLGYGRLGRKVCEKLTLQGIEYVSIESNMHNVIEAQKEGRSVLFGNASKKSILESVNIYDSIAIIVAFDNSEKVHLVCEILSAMSLDARVIIKVDKFQEEEELQKEFPQFNIVVGTEQIALGMLNSILTCELN